MSTLFYLPLLSFYHYKVAFDLLGGEITELILRVLFCSCLYSIIGYRVEKLSKQSFMGCEKSDKAFHRWMKIFETFPEGIALVRNNYILCSNRALSYILNVGTERSQEDDPLYAMLQQDLEKTRVKHWVKNPSE